MTAVATVVVLLVVGALVLLRRGARHRGRPDNGVDSGTNFDTGDGDSDGGDDGGGD